MSLEGYVVASWSSDHFSLFMQNTCSFDDVQ